MPRYVAEVLGEYDAGFHGRFGVVNRSERVLIMIDEAHRTQSSDLGNNLFEAFPNATRIAISRRRTVDRAKNRFAAFPQAISNTNPAAPNSSKGSLRCPSTSPSSNRVTPTLPASTFTFGAISRNRVANTPRFASACARVTPAFKRARG